MLYGDALFIRFAEQVIAGLDCAVATMLKGEFSQVTVRPEYGFGNDEIKLAVTTVPPWSTLIYEVELVDFIKVMMQPIRCFNI